MITLDWVDLGFLFLAVTVLLLGFGVKGASDGVRDDYKAYPKKDPEKERFS